MRKSIFFVLLMMLVAVCILPSFAANIATVSLDKEEYLIGEDIHVAISGVTPEQIEKGACFGLYHESDKNRNETVWGNHLMSMNNDFTWTFKAPMRPGNYEIRLFADEEQLFAIVKKTFKIVYWHHQDEFILTLDRAVYEPNELMAVEVLGADPLHAEAGAHVEIFRAGAAHEFSYKFGEYLSEADAGRMMISAPTDVGKYVMRLYITYEENKKTFVVEKPFAVAYKAEGDASFTLLKNTYMLAENIDITVNKLTKAQIDTGACVGIYQKGAAHDKPYFEPLDMKKGTTVCMRAPVFPGTYELRLYASSVKEDGSLLYSRNVAIDGTPSALFMTGYEGISAWAVPDVVQAMELGLVDETLLERFGEPITRAEFARLAVFLNQKLTGFRSVMSDRNTFQDTQDEYVLRAHNLKIVMGVTDIYFEPDAFVTREALSTMLHRTLYTSLPKLNRSVKNPVDFTDKAQFSNWANEAIQYLSGYGIINGTPEGAFLPQDECTIEAAIALVNRTYQTFKDKK